MTVNAINEHPPALVVKVRRGHPVARMTIVLRLLLVTALPEAASASALGGETQTLCIRWKAEANADQAVDAVVKAIQTEFCSSGAEPFRALCEAIEPFVSQGVASTHPTLVHTHTH